MDQAEFAQIAHAIFSDIEAANPSVRFDKAEELVEGESLPVMDVREQPGVTLSMSLYISGDELYLDCGAFHASWFPLKERPVREKYIDCVSGLLRGTHRVVEHSRGSRITRANLQTWNGEAWVPVSSWSRLTWPWPRLRESAVLVNSAAPSARTGA